jgi:hypothetical protein
MKLIRQGLIGALALSLAANALSQTITTDTQLSWVGARPFPTDLLSVTHDSLPDTGLTFYSVQRWNQIPPVPTDWTRKLPDSATASLTYYISPSFGTNRIIVDDRLVNYDQAYAELQNQRAVLNAAARLLNLPEEIIPEDEPGGQIMYSLQIPTDGSLWLEITNVTDGLAFLNLDNATNSVYAIWTTTDLLSAWHVDWEVFPTNQSVMPFALATRDRQNLFVRAQDWTTVDSDSDGIPDWWIWMNFGRLDLCATNLDSQGHTLWYDYTNGLDPNIIAFSLSSPNSTVLQTAAPIQINLYAGWPCYYSVLVNDTNHANALWLPYPGTNIVANLGTTDGLYAVTVGLRGLPQSAQPAWQTLNLTLDQTPPAIHLTSPTNTAVPYPLIQLVGYSEEALSSITFAVGQQQPQRGCIISQYYDPALHKITTNFWQCYDIPINPGTNFITVQATDLAGNISTNIYTFTFTTNDLPPTPAVRLTWPQDGMTISTNQISIQGQLDDPTVGVTILLPDTNGIPWVYRALVERRGQFWFDRLPLNPGSNFLTLVATDVAGKSNTTNFTLVQSDMLLSANPVPQETLGSTNTTVTGYVQDDSFDVWVNGVQAQVDTFGAWTATNVPVIGDGMYCFYLQAQPHSGSRASGTMQQRSAQPFDIEFPTIYNTAGFQLQIPYLRVVKYQNDWSLDPGNGVINGPHPLVSGATPPSQQFHYAWNDSTLSSAWWTIQGQSFTCTTNFSWPTPDHYWSTANYWYWDRGFAGTATNTCSTNTLTPGPFQIFLERCDFKDVQRATNSQGQVVNTNTFTRAARTEIELITGGRPLVQGSGIFLLWAYATNVTNLRWPYLGDLAGTPVPATNIGIGGHGPLEYWGGRYISLPDNSTNRVTPTVTPASSTNFFYIFDIYQKKYTLVIRRDTTTDITGTSSQASVGSQISLLARLEPQDAQTPAVTNYQWQAPGPTFAYYLATSQYAIMYPLTNTAGSNIVYYYRDNTNAPVICTATAMDQNLKNFGFISVSKPDAHIAPRIFTNVTADTNWYKAPGTNALHFGGSFGIPGIQFSNNLYMEEANYQWVQVGHAELEILSDEDNHWYHAIGDGLDTDYPYPKQSQRTSNDNPGTECTGKDVKCGMLLTMHLMYRPQPATTNEMWVSLRTVDWAWSGEATNINGTFFLVNGTRGATQDAAATNNPTWTNNIMSTYPRPLNPE